MLKKCKSGLFSFNTLRPCAGSQPVSLRRGNALSTKACYAGKRLIFQVMFIRNSNWSNSVLYVKVENEVVSA